MYGHHLNILWLLINCDFYSLFILVYDDHKSHQPSELQGGRRNSSEITIIERNEMKQTDGKLKIFMIF